MKLREIPSYRWRVIRLNLSRVKRLHSVTTPTADVIVSFTSIESRLHICHLTVRSILTGTMRPQRVVLWLNDKLRGRVPDSLLRLVGSRFEIRYVANDEPYLKLLPSLHAFPQSAIVTCDDDVIYAPNWLEILYADHLRFPQDIIAHVCRRIAQDESGAARPYLLWNREKTYSASYEALLPLGFAGILYPADSLDKEVHHAALYRALAPKADDLWFKFMSLRNGTNSRKVSRASGTPMMIPGSQTMSLWSTNCHDGNLLQWEAIVNHYGRPAFVSPLPQ